MTTNWVTRFLPDLGGSKATALRRRFPHVALYTVFSVSSTMMRLPVEYQADRMLGLIYRRQRPAWRGAGIISLGSDSLCLAWHQTDRATDAGNVRCRSVIAQLLQSSS